MTESASFTLTDTEVGSVFAALADPVRRRLVDLVATRGIRTASELAGQTAMTRQGVTKHLTVLRDAGILLAEPHGREVHYRVDSDRAAAAAAWLAQRADRWQGQLLALKRAAETD